MAAEPLVAPPARIAVAGDWHGNTSWAVRAVRRSCAMLPQDGPRILLHLGDLGIWPDRGGREFLASLDAALAGAGAQLWFVDGNHEDHDLLGSFSAGRDEAGRDGAGRDGAGRDGAGRDGRVQLTERVWHLPRGYRWTWHGREWLALGGAVSLDRAERTAGRDWWPAEEITAEQAAAVAAAGPADVMITHDCPAGISHAFTAPPPSWSRADLARDERHRERLAQVARSVRPRWLLHGHLHQYYQRKVDLGWGQVAVTGLDCDGAQQGNWGILDAAQLRWIRLHGRPLSGLARGVMSRAGSGT